ncbi:MAG: metal ABC transporter substrate-binding protein [candidate division NC10 bacterium]|nr:metal ABC transporter substrate-binding protein [candidate division NC10 bacterium]
MAVPLPLAVFLAALLGSAPDFALAANPLSVVTSNTVLADLVANVGGDKVRVRSLAPAGTDPHTFQPTPDSIRTLSQARVAFFNGSGLEEWWDKTIHSVKKPDVPVIELSKGLATIRMPGHSPDGQSHAEGQDPHVWLDPNLVKAYVDKIRDALSQADGANSGFYADRAKTYQVKLDELDAWIRTEVEKIPIARRKIVTFHDAFQYFAHRYGLAVKGFVVVSPGKEPSAKALAELTRRIKEERIPAVFAEADFNAKLLEVLAKDAGVKVVTNLYDGSLSSGPPADTYINMLRHNVTQTVNALR